MATRRQKVQQPTEIILNKIRKTKLVLLGDSGVGKTAIVLQFVKAKFIENNENTIGASFFTQSVCIDDTAVKFDIWDTAGQEKFHSIVRFYYRGAEAAVIVYNIQNQESFDRAKFWVKEIRKQVSPNIVIALVGNKSDLADYRTVNYEDAKQYAKDNGLIFMETSAKTAVNVNEIFLAVAKELPKNEELQQECAIKIKPPKRSRNCCTMRRNRKTQLHRNYED